MIMPRNFNLTSDLTWSNIGSGRCLLECRQSPGPSSYSSQCLRIFHYDDSHSQDHIDEFVCLLSPKSSADTDSGLARVGTAEVVWHSHDYKSMRTAGRKGCSVVLIFTLRVPHTNFLHKRLAKLKKVKKSHAIRLVGQHHLERLDSSESIRSSTFCRLNVRSIDLKGMR